jgi:hypothetical protein
VHHIRATANAGYDVPIPSSANANTDLMITCGSYRARVANGLNGGAGFQGENGAIFNVSTGAIPVNLGDSCIAYYYQQTGASETFDGVHTGVAIDNWLEIEVVD